MEWNSKYERNGIEFDTLISCVWFNYGMELKKIRKFFVQIFISQIFFGNFFQKKNFSKTKFQKNIQKNIFQKNLQKKFQKKFKKIIFRNKIC